MPIVRANGLNLHAQELGQGRPVFMSHGLLLGNLASWYFSAAAALRPRHRVLLYDLRGHGRSERPPAGYDVATMAADLGGLIQVLAPEEETVDLVGHSFGGLVSLRYALDHPGRVRRLVLVDVPLPPSSAEEIDFCRQAYDQPDLESVADLVQSQVMGGRRGALSFARQLCFLVNESTCVDDLEAEEDIPDAVLAGVEQPVLCVYGTQSSCLPAGRRLSGLLPGGRLELLEGGHFLTLECPVELAAAVSGFLDEALPTD